MSTTQIPPGVPVPPSSSGPFRDGSDLFDSRIWESTYRELHDAPVLLIQLQNEVSRSRKREAFWISVAVHLVLVILIVNSTRFGNLFPRPAVLVSPEARDKDLTFLELPPDAQKITKRPDTNKISDRDRIATSKAPQLDREQLRKIIEAGRQGHPGPATPPAQQSGPAAPAPQAQQAPPPPPPLPKQDQVAKLQTPPVEIPKPSFGNNTLSAGSSIEQAARAALANRGGYAGDSGYGLGQGGRQPTARMGPLDVLSDTMGVDFGPYLQRVLHDVRMNWYNLIPEAARAPLMKKGKVSIEFAITKDGKVAGMKLVSTSGDVALDRGAWGGITASNPFPPLPTEFGGQYLALRFTFFYNPDKSDLE